MSETTESNETTASITKPKRRWVRTLLLCVVLLLCGMVIGSGLTLHGIWRHVSNVMHNPEEVSKKITTRLTHKLNLTDEQAEQVGAIIEERHRNLNELRLETMPKIHAEFDRVDEEIAAILTPEQQAEWEEMRDRMRHRWLPPPPPGIVPSEN
jgi:hypothetical protein